MMIVLAVVGVMVVGVAGSSNGSFLRPYPKIALLPIDRSTLDY